MRYRALQHRTIKLDGKAQMDYDADTGATLVPDEKSRVFVHWKNENGKLVSTYTMTFPTHIEGKVTLINALDTPAVIRAVW
jgi:hypothetical protein